jgi:hypothetical protein
MPTTSSSVSRRPTSRSSAPRRRSGPDRDAGASLTAFYPAEAYHQNYLALHPTSPTSSTTTCRSSSAEDAVPESLRGEVSDGDASRVDRCHRRVPLRHARGHLSRAR